MSLSKSKILILVITLLTQYVFGQLVTVKDPVFNSWLCSRVPLAMNEDCTQLDTLKAKSEYASPLNIYLSNKGISSADEVLFFSNADTIYLNQNNLASFPTDLSSFRSLGRLNLAWNKLTVAPDIHYTNKFGADTAVKLVYLQSNQIKALPVSWGAYNQFTQVVDVSNNELEDVPSFVNYTQIRRLDVSDNYLDFDDFIPIMAHPSWGIEVFTFFPQKEFKVDMDTLVKIGDKIQIDISTGLASNEYSLLKGNSRIDQNKTGVFEIDINSEDDLGEYWFKVNNDSFPDASNFLASLKYSIRLEKEGIEHTFVKEDEVFVFSPNGDGVSDSFYIEGEGEAMILNQVGQALRVEQLPFEWFGDDSNGKLSKPGLHLIKFKNDEYLKVLITY